MDTITYRCPGQSPSEILRYCFCMAYGDKAILKDDSLFKMYQKNVVDNVTYGYAKKLTPEEIKTWYLPHLHVTDPYQPGKVRTVFDAVAKLKGQRQSDHWPLSANQLHRNSSTFSKIPIIADVKAKKKLHL